MERLVRRVHFQSDLLELSVVTVPDQESFQKQLLFELRKENLALLDICEQKKHFFHEYPGYRPSFVAIICNFLPTKKSTFPVVKLVVFALFVVMLL